MWEWWCQVSEGLVDVCEICWDRCSREGPKKSECWTFETHLWNGLIRNFVSDTEVAPLFHVARVLWNGTSQKIATSIWWTPNGLNTTQLKRIHLSQQMFRISICTTPGFVALIYRLCGYQINWAPAEKRVWWSRQETDHEITRLWCLKVKAFARS